MLPFHSLWPESSLIQHQDWKFLMCCLFRFLENKTPVSQLVRDRQALIPTEGVSSWVPATSRAASPPQSGYLVEGTQQSWSGLDWIWRLQKLVLLLFLPSVQHTDETKSVCLLSFLPPLTHKCSQQMAAPP